MWNIWQTLNVLLDYWYSNPNNLIYWQQDVVSQNFLLPWFWIPASWGFPSPSLHLISSLNLSCPCLWFLLCFANRLKSPPSASYPWSAFCLILFWWAEGMILFEPLFLQSENLFCDTSLQHFQHRSLHLPSCFAVPLLPSMNYMQCFSVSLMSFTYTGKITSLLLITTLANCVYCSLAILFL